MSAALLPYPKPPPGSDLRQQIDRLPPGERVEILRSLLGDAACRQLGIAPMPPGFTLSVVIPVFNERAWLAELLRRVRAVPIPKEFFGGDRGRRKASIVANHQLALRLSSCGNHALQFFLVQGERLFDKHMLSQLQRAPREFGMCIVPRGNHD